MLINSGDGGIGEMREHMAQSSLRIGTVTLGRVDQRVNGRCRFAIRVCGGEHVIASSDDDALQARSAAESCRTRRLSSGGCPLESQGLHLTFLQKFAGPRAEAEGKS